MLNYLVINRVVEIFDADEGVELRRFPARVVVSQSIPQLVNVRANLASRNASASKGAPWNRQDG